jgi:hypothetical protein
MDGKEVERDTQDSHKYIKSNRIALGAAVRMDVVDSKDSLE